MKSGRKGLQIVLKHVKPSQHVLTVQGGGSDVVRFEYGCVGQGHKAFSRGLWLGFNVVCLFYPASLGEDEASHFAGRLFFVHFFVVSRFSAISPAARGGCDLWLWHSLDIFQLIPLLSLFLSAYKWRRWCQNFILIDRSDLITHEWICFDRVRTRIGWKLSLSATLCDEFVQTEKE